MEYGGGSDPKRSMELLWGIREAPSRGPKQRLSLAEVVRAAIELADVDGLGVLSMRRVAERLGIGTMSLYTYVPAKAELIDVMVDTALGELPRQAGVEGGWRARLERIARDNWATYRRHPWLLQVPITRAVLGPNVIAKYDHELRAVDGIGLTDLQMDSVLTLVLGHVHGTARAAAEVVQVERQTGLTDEQWWEAHAPLLDKVFDASRYPLAARVGAAAGTEHQAPYAPEHAFEFGLQRVLDGIEAFVEARSG
ncbi:MAG: TetR/AcrR family transcriptional regulator [Sciscionella sp.]